MNICMVGFGIGKTHGAFVGGHVNNAVNLSIALAENGFQVHIVTTPPIYSNQEDLEPSYELQKGVTLHPVDINYGNASNEISIKGRQSLLFGFKSYFQIVSTIRELHEKESFDVIHGHSGFPWVALIPAYLRMRESIPSVHTLCCPIKEGWVHQTISKFCLSKLDLTIVLSDNVKKSLKSIVSDDRIKVIPPLIDLKRFNDCSNIIGKSDSQHLLYIGNLSKTKGLYILLRALKIVKNDFPNIKLFLGLDMPLKEFIGGDLEIKKVVEDLDLIENVIPQGIIENLPEVMAKSDIFVSPFLNTYGPADYPLAILEAMVCGLPIVTTKVGGIPEIVKHKENGLLVEPNNPSELANSIIFLLQNEDERKRMGKEGTEFVRELNKNVVEEIQAIYKEVAAG